MLPAGAKTCRARRRPPARSFPRGAAEWSRKRHPFASASHAPDLRGQFTAFSGPTEGDARNAARAGMRGESNALTALSKAKQASRRDRKYVVTLCSTLWAIAGEYRPLQLDELTSDNTPLH